ncbi:retropepsin-like aspartic protease [Roseofilum sp. BLCC_M154]|uniref:Retropepsin-like aspartic protease n=1 Tax=Roseofilum acuticapitatum BLCC-M154 TaxID=3022444 RepID=A0ABT7AV79_9CYAN|nr:retropepsin-like aspartic protease [Roseofilum acuticapitatum]MDJ1170819.1 retropepsin-like aspartic protease [Roseofilum acuticapitatum BLCC-M154]
MSSRRIYRLNRQGNLLWLRASVGRARESPIVLRLLLDTGSSYTVLPCQILECLGCDLEHPLQTTTIVTASATVKLPIVSVPWFNCLGVRKEDFSVVAMDLPLSSFANGLLGIDFLREEKAIIDVFKGEISLS